MEGQRKKFYFTNRDVVMLAAFSALLLGTDFVWILGPFVGNMIYGVIEGILLITAAIIINKRYTVLTLGIVRTTVEIFVASAFVGTLTAFDFLASALVLEAVLQLYGPYASSLRINVLGMILYGLVTRTMFISISVFVYGMVLPGWLLAFMMIVPLITYAIGGFLGHKIGKRVKYVVETI